MSKKDKTAKTKPAKSDKKSEVVIREYANVQHDYTDQEKLELSKRQVASLQRIGELEEQKKSVVADLTAKIKTEKALVGELSNKLSSGYEMQAKECRIELNRKTGLKSLFIYAPGTPADGQHVRDEAMTQADYEKLPLEDLPPAPVIPKGKKAKEAKAQEIEDAMKAQQLDERIKEAAAAN